jgi:hypothetical protein
MIALQEIFDVSYGNKFDLNKMNQSNGCVHFVGRSAKNNGVTAKVAKLESITPYSDGLITVALGGSVLASFLQVKPFYTGQNIAVLSPKENLSTIQKLFYCKAIHYNAYRFSTCGREANRTLRDLQVPKIENLPKWVNDIDLTRFDGANHSFSENKTQELKTESWRWFELQELFEIKKGKRLTKANMKKGNVPFIGAIDSNNGYREHIGQKPIHEGNTISVNYNGSVAEAFFQPKDFWASDDVNVLYPKFELNQYIALFIITLIKHEKYRFNYGRKWHMERMNVSKIKLPVEKDGVPNYQFMENYIKTLPFSKRI